MISDEFHLRLRERTHVCACVCVFEKGCCLIVISNLVVMALFPSIRTFRGELWEADGETGSQEVRQAEEDDRARMRLKDSENKDR